MLVADSVTQSGWKITGTIIAFARGSWSTPATTTTPVTRRRAP